VLGIGVLGVGCRVLGTLGTGCWVLATQYPLPRTRYPGAGAERPDSQYPAPDTRWRGECGGTHNPIPGGGVGGGDYIPAVSRPASVSAPHVLLVRFGAMGDVILTTPLIRALRRAHPSVRLTVVTRDRYAPLLEGNPHVHRVIALGPGSTLATIARDLRLETFTHRLDLHRSLRSRQLRWLVGGRWTSYPKHRVARTVLIRMHRDIYRDRRPVAERYFDAARSLGVHPDGDPAEVFVDVATLRRADQALAAGGRRDDSRTLLALAPGAAHASKRWPLAHWEDLAARLEARGTTDLVVLGGPDDAAAGRAIAAAAPTRAVNLAGTLTLRETAAVLKRARAAVAGDTGLLHLSTAVGTPVVGLYGPTVEAFGFFPYHGRATVLQRDLPCRPCSSHGGPVCPLGHHRCLVDLDPPAVVHALSHLPR